MTNDYLHGLFSLARRGALVSGASSGLGRELASGLARVTRRGAPPSAWTRRTRLFWSAAAWRRCSQAISAISRSTARWRARCAHVGQIDEVQPETYDEIMAVNLRAPFFLSQAVLPLLATGGGGKIINIGSLNTAYGLGKLSVYGLAKSAIALLTRTLAFEWAVRTSR